MHEEIRASSRPKEVDQRTREDIITVRGSVEGKYLVIRLGFDQDQQSLIFAESHKKSLRERSPAIAYHVQRTLNTSNCYHMDP